jgi:hypothetical protein
VPAVRFATRSPISSPQAAIASRRAASSSGKSIPSSAGLTRSPCAIRKKNLGMQFS